MKPKNTIRIIPLLSFIFLFLINCTYPRIALAAPTLKIEQQINLINQEYSTISTSDVPADESLGLILWDSSKYNGEVVYFEALIYCDTCTGGNQAANATLYNDTDTSVSGSVVTTTSGNYVLRRSADISGNLTDNEEYTVRLAVDATSGTAFLKAARLIIVQDSSQITDTQNQIELGNSDTTTSTSYELMTSPKIIEWDANDYTDVQNIYFEATLVGSDGSATSYAALSLSSNCSSTVTDAEVSITGTTWDRARSVDITSNLSDDTDYWVCVKTTASDTGSIANAKLIIDQQNSTDGIYNIQLYHQYINTLTTHSTDTYTSKDFLNEFNPTNISADIKQYYFEATIKTDNVSNAAFAQLYNLTNTAAISGSEVTTATTGYTRKRSGDIVDNLPSTTKTLDTQLKNNSTDTTSVSTSWLIIQANQTPDPELTFTVSSVGANTVNNAITTSEASSYSELPFGNLTFSTPKYVAHELYASTNASSGYTVSMQLSNYLQGVYPANNIDPFIAPWTAPTTWTEPTGISENTNTGWIGANTTDTRVPNWGSANEKFGAVSDTANTVMYSSTQDSGTTTYVTYAIEVNILQPADLYSGTLIYNILPIY